MRIGMDAMGGEKAPACVVEAAVAAVETLGIEIVLFGDKEKIKPLLVESGTKTNRITIVHTEEAVADEDDPVKVVRAKKDASMFLALRALKDKKVDAVVSAGNTGALLSGATLLVGRIKGVDRPALGTMIPTDKEPVLMLDCGANAECRPSTIAQFGVMGSIYMEKVRQVPSPSVGLINIGVEPGKGTKTYRDAYHLLSKNKTIRFIGNVETRDIPDGNVDVLVCDGFTGNVLLKMIEGLAKMFMGNLKRMMTDKKIKSVAALIWFKTPLEQFKKKMDANETGGAPFLGVDGVVVKAHGNSNTRAFYQALVQAKDFVESGVVTKIKKEIS